MKPKLRKLYSVRHTPAGLVFSRPAGHKTRLLPRAAAARVAKRLSRAGLDVSISPMHVKVSPEQAAYLDHRYR